MYLVGALGLVLIKEAMPAPITGDCFTDTINNYREFSKRDGIKLASNKPNNDLQVSVYCDCVQSHTNLMGYITDLDRYKCKSISRLYEVINVQRHTTNGRSPTLE